MKSLVLRSLAWASLLCASLAFAQEWTDPITIGNGYTPDFDIDPVSGKLYIVHHNNGLIYTEMNAQGVILVQEPINVASQDGIGRHQFGATIAFNPKTGRAHVCFRVNTTGNFYDIYYTRRKADDTWTAPLRLVQGKERAYSVRMDIDNNGVAHIVHGQLDGNDLIGVATYMRINNSDVVDQTISELRKYRVDDRVELSVAADNSIHVILSSPDDLAAGSAVTYYASTDGGATLPKYADIHEAGVAKGRNGNADVTLDKLGNVHFAYGSAGFPASAGPRTLHYVRYVGENKIRDVVVTEDGELQEWENHSLGIGTVGVSDDGKYVVMAYQVASGGQLRARLSKDGGAAWSDFTPLASVCGGDEGRDKQLVRGRNNTFYLIYPSSQAVHLRILKAANDAPTANAGGPYTGKEGTAINFDASKSAGDVPILLYRWDWTSDGVYDDSSAVAKASHTYPDNFTGFARLQVKAQDGLRGIGQAQVTVTNVAPVADAGGPYAGGANKAIALSGSATDAGAADVLTYAWDLDNNGSFEKPGKNVNVTFTSAGTKKVKLQAKDDDGAASVDSAIVEVGSGAPNVTKIPDQTIQEGQTFAQIQLDNFVTDFDHADNQITWTASGQVKLVVTIANRIAKVALPDSEFAGAEQIIFTAKDPDNNTGASTATFKVNGVNDEPRVTTIAAQRVNEGKPFEKITLDNFVFDPDHADAQIIWSAAGQVNLVVSIVNRIATIAPADSEWAGTERIDFTAKDPLGAQALIAQVRFTIDPTNDAPRFVVVPEQIINRGGAFPVLDLSTFIKDPDDALAALELTASGNAQLIPAINGLTVTMLTPSVTFTGSESITLTAKDPAGAFGSRVVKFTVRDVNTSPRWLNSKNYNFSEDDTLQIPLEDLRARVVDNEDPKENFVFFLVNNQNVKAFASDEHFNFYANANWNGVETVGLVVSDGRRGRDTVATQITVRAVVDPLRDFTVISPVGLLYSQIPPSIQFNWQATSDPDHPGAAISYVVSVNYDNERFDGIFVQRQVNSGTRLDLTTAGAGFVKDRRYFWRVEAFSTSNLTKLSSKNGVFTIGTVSVTEHNEERPEAFALKPNYPNPFNPQTTIAFDLARASEVTVAIYNAEGRLIATLVEGALRPGGHKVVWDAKGVASGVYFAELRVKDNGTVVYQARQKMSLVR